MLWTVNIDLVGIWYYILISVFLIFGFLGSFMNLEGNKSPVPMFFAIVISIILYIFANVLEPLFFGVRYFAIYSMEWYISAFIGIMFLILFVEIWYNNAVKGSVIE